MTAIPLIAVADATGVVGGAVARAILKDPLRRYRLRALVRSSHSPQGEALANAGAEVVEVELDDATSTLRGLRGAHAAFAVTDFWAHGSPERELSQARAMATAARLADLGHVIWCTHEDSRTWMAPGDERMPTLMQRYKVPPFDAKGEADVFFGASGVPVTYFRPALAWEQLLGFGMGPRRAEDGSLRLALPLGGRPIPGIALDDIGWIVLRLLGDAAPTAARTVGVAAAHHTGEELAAAFRRALGESVMYDAVPFGSWRASGIPAAEELGNMFQFMHDFSAMYCAHRPVEAARELHPAVQSLDAWLTVHRSRIPSV
ncbi:MAG: NmrA family NAD(P)-binding protein [Gemmatimonadota bacterium]